ncbi:hypothetical protein [Blastococcus sp. SYSU D00820]
MDTALRPAVPPLPAVVRLPEGQTDVEQEFVSRLRAAGPAFAAAAGADTAVVREVVPPARHRRARCRIVLRYPSTEEVDLTFIGPVSRAGATPERAFDLQIQGWLASDRSGQDTWLVKDEESPDGLAVDVTAWSAIARTAAV